MRRYLRCRAHPGETVDDVVLSILRCKCVDVTVGHCPNRSVEAKMPQRACERCDRTGTRGFRHGLPIAALRTRLRRLSRYRNAGGIASRPRCASLPVR